MDWDYSLWTNPLVSIGFTLVLFLVMILAPAFVIRANAGGKSNMPLRKPLRGALVCALAGGIAMYLTIMTWGDSRSYWVGWGLVGYAVGVLVATPLLALILGCPMAQTYKHTAVCLVGQVLPLIVIASSLFAELSFGMALQYLFLVCIIVLPLTWVRRRGGGESTS